MALTPKQQRFVEEYLVDLNATRAAVRAGYSAKTANREGARLLSKAVIAAAVTEAQKARSDRTAVTADQVLLRLWSIASADPNELVEYRRTCCRYCHGTGHGYQRTAGELARDRAAHASLKPKKGEKIPPFDEQGGSGFDARRPPHPGCPECFGEGVGRAFFKDTRGLSGKGLCLYAGVRETKEGLEVKLHDQHSALVDVGRHLGMFKERHEHTGPGGKPIPHEHSGSITVSATAEDVALARAILDGSPGDVHPDGGPKPVAAAP